MEVQSTSGNLKAIREKKRKQTEILKCLSIVTLNIYLHDTIISKHASNYFTMSHLLRRKADKVFGENFYKLLDKME